MAIEKIYIPGKTVKHIWRNPEKFRFDLAIQRNEVWENDRKSLFIHTLLYGYPFPPCYAQDQGDGLYWMLDGKQRITTAISYVKGEFALNKHTPEIDGIKLAGKKFSQLPEELKEKILDTDFQIYQLRGMSEGELAEMFFRLNNGSALSKIELTRAIAGTEMMAFIRSVAAEPFFAQSAALTERGRNRFVDEELVLQICYLITRGEAVSLSGKELRNFVTDVRGQGVSEETQEAVRRITAYLNKAFPQKERYLKKVHVPMIFLLAIKAEEQGILPEKYSLWVETFFKGLLPGARYHQASRAGSSQKEKVAERLNEMEQDFQKFFQGVVT